jgi:hypothetical protein
MLSYTDLGMALLVIAALIAAISLINRHPEVPRHAGPMTHPPMPMKHNHVRMFDDPAQNLGRRKDDNAGGES